MDVDAIAYKAMVSATGTSIPTQHTNEITRTHLADFLDLATRSHRRQGAFFQGRKGLETTGEDVSEADLEEGAVNEGKSFRRRWLGAKSCKFPDHNPCPKARN